MPPKKTIAFGKISAFGKPIISIEKKEEKQAQVGDGFGRFGKTEEEFIPEPTKAVEEAMGFQGFGSKFSNSFDLEALVEQTRQVAKERSQASKSNSLKDSEDQEDEDSEDDLVGPAPPVPFQDSAKPAPQKPTQKFKDSMKMQKPQDDSDDSDDDSSDNEGGDTPEKAIPASHEISLNHGTRPVTALHIDHSGARLVTGSVDYDVRLWDFAGMSAALQSFRTVRPCEW